ncbi:hypothetical protein GCM10027347_22110 [Larkinella harenae]
MNPQIKRIATILFTVLAAGMTIFSGIMKFLPQSPEMMANMTKMGIAPYLKGLGMMEISFALLYLYPKTMKLGFILLSCYFAGALATELSHGTPFNAFLPMALIWISAFLRDQTIFFPSSKLS